MGWLRLIPEYSASLLMLPLVGAALLMSVVHFWLARQNEFFERWSASINVVIGILGILLPMYLEDDFRQWVDSLAQPSAIERKGTPLRVAPVGELYLRGCPARWCPAVGVLERGSGLLQRSDLMMGQWFGWYRVQLTSGRYCALEDYDRQQWRCRKWQHGVQVTGWVAASGTGR